MRIAAVNRPPDGMRRRAVVLVVLVLLVPACGAADGRGGPSLTVMTRNVYLGTGLTNIVGVRSLDQLVAAVTEDWANVQANDFAARAGALADEIAEARPDVVGLQEVTLWREEEPADLSPVPAARDVVLDVLAMLREALADRRTPYTVAAVSTNADLEVPRRGGTGLVDLRITDRDVLLVRADVAGRVANPRRGHYVAQLELPSLPRPVRNTRGWASIDVRTGGTSVRVLTTHLEVGSQGAAADVQLRQGEEFLELVAASPHPVVALGDFNSPADGSGTDTYETLTAVLDDAWTVARPADPGPTCCQDRLLSSPVPRSDARLDLVLTTDELTVTGAALTGAEPFRPTPPPLWASDHVGVTARVDLPD